MQGNFVSFFGAMNKDSLPRIFSWLSSPNDIFAAALSWNAGPSFFPKEKRPEELDLLDYCINLSPKERKILFCLFHYEGQPMGHYYRPLLRKLSTNLKTFRCFASDLHAFRKCHRLSIAQELALISAPKLLRSWQRQTGITQKALTHHLNKTLTLLGMSSSPRCIDFMVTKMGYRITTYDFRIFLTLSCACASNRLFEHPEKKAVLLWNNYKQGSDFPVIQRHPNLFKLLLPLEDGPLYDRSYRKILRFMQSDLKKNKKE